MNKSADESFILKKKGTMKYVTLKTVLPQVAAWFVCSVA
jgi:hypothetical protein